MKEIQQVMSNRAADSLIVTGLDETACKYMVPPSTETHGLSHLRLNRKPTVFHTKVYLNVCAKDRGFPTI